MQTIPRFVSFVAFALGCFDIVRGMAHTVFVGPVAQNRAGLSLLGPTGLDQMTLMVAFGASNLITAAALIYASLADRRAVLILIAVIPCAHVLAGVGLQAHGAELVGQGAFPGKQNVAVYNAVCVATLLSALLWMLWRPRPLAPSA